MLSSGNDSGMGTAVIVTLLMLLAVGIVVDQLLCLRKLLREPRVVTIQNLPRNNTACDAGAVGQAFQAEDLALRERRRPESSPSVRWELAQRVSEIHKRMDYYTALLDITAPDVARQYRSRPVWRLPARSPVDVYGIAPCWLLVLRCRVLSRAVVRLRVTIPNARPRSTAGTTRWDGVCLRPVPARVESPRHAR